MRQRQVAHPHADRPRYGVGNGGRGRALACLAAAENAPMRVLKLSINGDAVELAAPEHWTLLEVLRYGLGLTGSKQGCDKGDCGACTVRIDGEPHLSCRTLALGCQGREVRTVEALPGANDLHTLLDAFDRTGAAQCGFCTPGFLMSAWSLLEKNKRPSRDDIKVAISSNLCRCTGYKSIVDAIDLAARMMRGEEPRMADLPGQEHLPPPIENRPGMFRTWRILSENAREKVAH